MFSWVFKKVVLAVGKIGKMYLDVCMLANVVDYGDSNPCHICKLASSHHPHHPLHPLPVFFFHPFCIKINLTNWNIKKEHSFTNHQDKHDHIRHLAIFDNLTAWFQRKKYIIIPSLLKTSARLKVERLQIMYVQ